ncbi:hypothetical protein F4805DRAFT_269009 [Annulohypoxylon moriforme]|nr:hypothetical protein F4805DRAFT_269009 [Annulohypoxylon moriforme]
MPSGQPTCAARIIRNNFLKYGWGATLTKETNDRVNDVKEDAGAMYQMQISRDRPVSATSLRAAVSWEHRHLAEQRLVSTPAIDEDLEYHLFSTEDGSLENGLEKIKKLISAGSKDIQMHPIFRSMRDRPYTLWPVRMDGAWVTLIFKSEEYRSNMHLKDYHLHRDRQVKKFTIIDPLREGRDARRKILQERLPKILAQGCIDLPEDVLMESFVKSEVPEWATGLVSYAVCREFIRRLRVHIYRKEAEPSDFLWEEFEEDLDLDSYRQSLMAACAHQAIEKSGFTVRLALEVPSEKSGHNPDALMRPSITHHDEVHRIADQDVTIKVPNPSQGSPIPRNPLLESKSDKSDVDMLDAGDEASLKPRQDEPKASSPSVTEKEPLGACGGGVVHTDDNLFENESLIEDISASNTLPKSEFEQQLPAWSSPSYSESDPLFEDTTERDLYRERCIKRSKRTREATPFPDYTEATNMDILLKGKRRFDTEDKSSKGKRRLDDEGESSKRRRLE